MKKQNSFDDFAVCAEHLHAAGYSTPAKLTIQVSPHHILLTLRIAYKHPAIYIVCMADEGVNDLLQGGSNGGLLMGAELTQVWNSSKSLCMDNHMPIEVLFTFVPKQLQSCKIKS